jgi:hypothetical protein
MILENTSIGVPMQDLAEAWPDGGSFTIHERKFSS